MRGVVQHGGIELALLVAQPQAGAGQQPDHGRRHLAGRHGDEDLHRDGQLSGRDVHPGRDVERNHGCAGAGKPLHGDGADRGLHAPLAIIYFKKETHHG